jgi:hypothetical protein
MYLFQDQYHFDNDTWIEQVRSKLNAAPMDNLPSIDNHGTRRAHTVLRLSSSISIDITILGGQLVHSSI